MLPSNRRAGPYQIASDVSLAGWTLLVAWAVMIGLAAYMELGQWPALGVGIAALVVGGIVLARLRRSYPWLHRSGPWKLLERPAARKRLVDPLAACRNEQSIAWLTVWHGEEVPTVKRLAAVFKAAGWQTQWSDLPQGRVVHADQDEEGIKVSGHNRQMVETVAQILSRQMRGVYPSHEPTKLDLGSRRLPSEANKVRVTIYREPRS